MAAKQQAVSTKALWLNNRNGEKAYVMLISVMYIIVISSLPFNISVMTSWYQYQQAAYNGEKAA